MSDNEQAEAGDAEAEVEADAAEDAESEESVETTDEESAGLEADDFVRVAYTIRTKDDGRVIDTTDEKLAEEEGLDTEEHEFKPRVIALGAGHVFPPVEDALEGARIGDEGTVEIPAADAFGEYDPEEVDTVKADSIPEDDRYPGAPVQIDGQQGHVEAIIGGRARVDFNHPLAGEDLEYEYELLEAVEGREEQAGSLLAMYLQQEPDVRIETVTEEEEVPVETDEDEEPEFETEEVETDVLYIEATPQMQMNQQWMFQKQQIASEIMDRLDLGRVVVEEIIEGGGMGGLGGMMGGMGGAGAGDVEEALEDVDVDADEIVDELDE